MKYDSAISHWQKFLLNSRPKRKYYLWGMRERLGDSWGLLISSNSLELLLNIGIFDFLSPCLIVPDFISGEINLDNILGGFIKEILGVHCSWLPTSCSCSSIFVLLPLANEDRSFLFVFMASNDGTSSSCLLDSFSPRFGFVRSFVSARGVNFSWTEIDSLFVIASLHGSSFVESLQSVCKVASLITGSFELFDVSMSADFTISLLVMISRYSWWRDGKLRYTRNSADFLAADQRVGGPVRACKVRSIIYRVPFDVEVIIIACRFIISS